MPEQTNLFEKTANEVGVTKMWQNIMDLAVVLSKEEQMKVIDALKRQADEIALMDRNRMP